MADEREEKKEGAGLVLVARKGGFGLPTACPSCLPAYFYLRFAEASFDMHYDFTNPDADHIPSVEHGDYVAFNNEKGGVIESLKVDGVVDLDSQLPSDSFPEWLSTKAMMVSWVANAVQYELWVASDRRIAYEIYFSELPWPISKVLHWKQTQAVKQLSGITSLNAETKEEEIYGRASAAFEALSTRLGEQSFFFDNRPTSVDAIFLGHALFVLHALPDTSVLQSKLLRHDNLVKYAENLKMKFLEAGSSSSQSVPRSPFDASSSSSSSTSRRRASTQWNAKPKPKPKREKTEEEKTFRRRAKIFLGTQLVAVLIFLSLLGGVDSSELEDGDDDGVAFEEE